MGSFILVEQSRLRFNSINFFRTEGEEIKKTTNSVGEWSHLDGFKNELVEASIANCLSYADAFLPVNSQRYFM